MPNTKDDRQLREDRAMRRHFGDDAFAEAPKKRRSPRRRAAQLRPNIAYDPYLRMPVVVGAAGDGADDAEGGELAYEPREAEVVPPHLPASAKCKTCHTPHSVSQHWSHAEGHGPDSASYFQPRRRDTPARKTRPRKKTRARAMNTSIRTKRGKSPCAGGRHSWAALGEPYEDETGKTMRAATCRSCGVLVTQEVKPVRKRTATKKKATPTKRKTPAKKRTSTKKKASPAPRKKAATKKKRATAKKVSARNKTAATSKADAKKAKTRPKKKKAPAKRASPTTSSSKKKTTATKKRTRSTAAKKTTRRSARRSRGSQLGLFSGA